MSRVALPAVLGPLVLIAAGCGSSEPPATTPGELSRKDELIQVHTLLTSAGTESGRGPKQASDLAKYEQGGSLGYRAVRSGDIVVVWGAAPAPEGEVAAGRGGTDIVAYEKKAPTDGGWVLLQNGTVKELTADEFKATPKAK